MDHRQFSSMSLAALPALAAMGQARAFMLEDLRRANACNELKSTLKKGALTSMGTFGVLYGLLGHEKVRRFLPSVLENASKLLLTFGHGSKVVNLLTVMNQAVKSVLCRGGTAVTGLFVSRKRPQLGTRFFPVVMKVTAKADLAFKLKEVAGKAVKLGLIKRAEAHVEKYLTDTTWDGLFLKIAKKDKKIREKPGSFGRSIFSQVFGALK